MSINKADIRPETNIALRAKAAATANQHSICLDQTSFPLRGATESYMVVQERGLHVQEAVSRTLSALLSTLLILKLYDFSMQRDNRNVQVIEECVNENMGQGDGFSTWLCRILLIFKYTALDVWCLTVYNADW